MSNLLQIENAPGLVRDTRSKAILNTNKKEATEYNIKARILRDQKDHASRLAQLQMDVAILAEEVRVLKELVDQSKRKL